MSKRVMTKAKEDWLGFKNSDFEIISESSFEKSLIFRDQSDFGRNELLQD